MNFESFGCNFVLKPRLFLQSQDLARRTSELAEKATEVGELQSMIDTLKSSENQVGPYR